MTLKRRHERIGKEKKMIGNKTDVEPPPKDTKPPAFGLPAKETQSFGTVIYRWWRENKVEHGPYGAFAGFERDLRKWCDSLELAYDDMDIYQQIQLFAFVTELLAEERCG